MAIQLAHPFHSVLHATPGSSASTSPPPSTSEPGCSAAAIIQNGHRPQWISIPNSSERIVDIIARYLYTSSPEDQFLPTGQDTLLSTVSRYVENNEKIELVFPAFPFKSPSTKKVLSSYPDLGEELLLRRLENLARTIEDYHPPGAVVRVVSDGIVYGEILGQSDSVVYRYNRALRDIAADNGLTHISFVRIADLLSISSELKDDNITEDVYLTSTPEIRAQFLAHTVPGFDMHVALKEDVGVLRTYRGYLRFLETDLECSPLMNDTEGKSLSGNARDRKRRLIAKEMLVNGAKFSHLVQARFPTAARLSVHAHDNSGPKFAFDMFPGGSMCSSPWHNVIMEKADGSFVCNHVSAFNPCSYETVHRSGRPYYLREHSEDRHLGDKINPYVTFTPNYPFGLVIAADPSAKISFQDLPMDVIRRLSLRHSALLLRGFEQVDREAFRKKAREMGDVVSWPQFGDILELKENPNLDMNSSLTCESMPMHYDGVFKTKKTASGALTHDPPTFQVFQCVHAPSESEGGKTLLTNTAMLLKQGMTASQRDWLKKTTYSVYTPQNKVFGGTKLKLPLVMRNEKTANDVLRWHEDWPQHVTNFKPAHSVINGVSEEDSKRIGGHLTDLLYDRRFCYAHTWATGDFLIADNIEMMHTRTAFKPCARELWRIHVN